MERRPELDMVCLRVQARFSIFKEPAGVNLRAKGAQGGPVSKAGTRQAPSPTRRSRVRGSRQEWPPACLPLATQLSVANVPGGKMLLKVADATAPVRGRRDRPHRRPDKLYGGKVYYDRSQKPGRYRRVAERTVSWRQGARRLRLLHGTV